MSRSGLTAFFRLTENNRLMYRSDDNINELIQGVEGRQIKVSFRVFRLMLMLTRRPYRRLFCKGCTLIYFGSLTD